MSNILHTFTKMNNMFNRKIKEANPFSSAMSIESLQSKSKSIIGVFQKTQKDLEDVNVKIEIEVTNRADELTRLQNEISSLNTQKETNARIAKNIDNILNN